MNDTCSVAVLFMKVQLSFKDVSGIRWKRRQAAFEVANRSLPHVVDPIFRLVVSSF